MKRVSILVSDKTARAIQQLAKTGHTSNWEAFAFIADHARYSKNGVRLVGISSAFSTPEDFLFIPDKISCGKG